MNAIPALTIPSTYAWSVFTVRFVTERYAPSQTVLMWWVPAHQRRLKLNPFAERALSDGTMD
jgi:hypothetical protein